MSRAFSPAIGLVLGLGIGLLAGCGDSSAEIQPSAGCADVIAVKVTPEVGSSEGDSTYRFDVTVSSDDQGWEKYADWWEVLDEDGSRLGQRLLTHPHDTEQPFTRSQSGIPVGGEQVIVRAHDSQLGYCGATMEVAVP